MRLDGWCKVALGNRGMTVEAARQCAKDQKEWRAMVHMQLYESHEAVFTCPVFFRTASSCFGCYHLEQGGMPLHDAAWDKL